MAALNRNNEEDRDVESVPRPPVQYPCRVCRETLLGQQVVQCPGKCTFCIHSKCLRDINTRNDKLLCSLCNLCLSPSSWSEFYIRDTQYMGLPTRLPDEAR